MIVHRCPVGPFEMNCYLAADPVTREGVVIDPGDEIEALLALIERERLEIRAILLTHGHIDHVARAQEMKLALGVPMYAHPAEAPLLAAAPQQARLFGLRPGPVPEVDGPLTGGMVFEAGPLRFQILDTPGHSPGGITLVSGQDAFVGDAIFAGSIGRTDLPGGDLPTLLRSIREQIYPLGDETVLHPGHGPATTVGRERATNPFVQG